MELIERDQSIFEWKLRFFVSLTRNENFDSLLQRYSRFFLRIKYMEVFRCFSQLSTNSDCRTNSTLNPVVIIVRIVADLHKRGQHNVHNPIIQITKPCSIRTRGEYKTLSDDLSQQQKNHVVLAVAELPHMLPVRVRYVSTDTPSNNFYSSSRHQAREPKRAKSCAYVGANYPTALHANTRTRNRRNSHGFGSHGMAKTIKRPPRVCVRTYSIILPP